MKRSKCLLVSWIWGALYAIYLVAYFINGNAAASEAGAAETLGIGLATMLVLPHMLCAVLAAIFNILGWAMNKRGFALTGAILYACAMVMFLMYFFFTLIPMILSFVGFARMKPPAEIAAKEPVEGENSHED